MRSSDLSKQGNNDAQEGLSYRSIGCVLLPHAPSPPPQRISAKSTTTTRVGLRTKRAARASSLTQLSPHRHRAHRTAHAPQVAPGRQRPRAIAASAAPRFSFASLFDHKIIFPELRV
jgi:hypothetical protein